MALICVCVCVCAELLKDELTDKSGDVPALRTD